MKKGDKKQNQNSDVFHKLEEVVSQVKIVVTGMDQKNDASHGLMFSSGMSEQKTGIDTSLIVWGAEKDIASMLYTACAKNETLAGIVSKVAINIAVNRMKPKTNNDHSSVIPENN